ncbi:MAG: hypothetical protein H6558_15585 [Lewinellaceae bacterium]|nr:hypothetical protein [Lewinellaceae bacterium]MCB9291509.1 hypothetical protein [Lewinellaceae bacterium]
METILILGGLFLVILIQFHLESERQAWERSRYRYLEPPAIPNYSPAANPPSQVLPVVAAIVFAFLLFAIIMHAKTQPEPGKDHIPTEKIKPENEAEANTPLLSS